MLEADAVLFDLDGVLIDSTVAIVAHWRAIAEWYGLDAELLLTRVHGARARDIVQRELGHAGPAVVAEAMQRHDEIELADTDGITALPGAERVLREARAGRWAIVTAATAPVAVARLRAAGLPVPPVLVGADDVTAGKPAPEGYLTAAARLGVRPTRCAVVEDSPLGIAAGRAAGAAVLGVATTHPADQLDAAHAVAGDLSAVSVTPGAAGTLVVSVAPH